MLPPQPRAALIAHELAHARNGDSTRGFFVGSALNALAARKLFNLKPAPEFLEWLEHMRIYRDGAPVQLDSGVRKQLITGLEAAIGK